MANLVAEYVKQVMNQDWLNFEQELFELPGSKVSAINEIYQHMILARGKRIRASLVLLLSAALGCQGENHIKLACIVEWLHAATLIHDDIIDNAFERSNQLSTHIKYGNTCAVLGGDYLYGIAFKKIAALSMPEITTCIANATVNIIEGELLQMQVAQSHSVTMDLYLEIIASKTAKLFEVCSQVAVLNSCAISSDAAKFGYYFGMAYQMLDDLQDYLADSEISGRKPGNDYIEGKLTLPFIMALPKLTQAQQENIQNKKYSFAQVVEILRAADGFVLSRLEIMKQLDSSRGCLNKLDDNVYKEKLLEIVSFFENRCNLLAQIDQK